MLNRSQVEKFQEIYRREYGKEISYEEALENAIKLVEMVRQIYKPIKKEDYENFINDSWKTKNYKQPTIYKP